MDTEELADQQQHLTRVRDVQSVVFPSEGKRLFGMLHRPTANDSRTAVVFLSSGLQSRVGPHRIYLKTARILAELGFYSFRVDLPGVGDSDEEALNNNFDCHDPCYVPAAIDYVVAACEPRAIVLLGLCSGGRVAIRAAARDPRVDGVVAWSVPIVSGPVNMPVAGGGNGYMGPKGARIQMRHWASRLFSASSWKKYLDSSENRAAAITMVRRTLGGFLPDRLSPSSPEQSEFKSSIRHTVAKKQVLFVYGEADRLARDELLDWFPRLASNRQPNCGFLEIPGGDHTFTSGDSESAAVNHTVRWLTDRFR